MRAPTLIGLTLCLAASSCSSQQAEVAAPPPAAPTSAPEATPPAPETPESNTELSAEEEAALADIEAAEVEEPPGTPKRQVLYRITQRGLHVETEGADFMPSAKSKKVNGGLGLELSVKATSTASLVLLSPLDGPMAFGGKVTRRSGQVETFGDRRRDTGSLPLAPGIPQAFSRDWPNSADIAPLAPGDELELHVGLWGLGTTEATRRPVRKFVVVKMKASAEGAMPIIEPPAP